MNEIELKHKLIADFLTKVDSYWEKEDDNEPLEDQLYFQPHDTEFQLMHPREMHFDKSWDWLMPVVEKINNMHIQGRPELRIGLKTELFYSPLTKDGAKQLKHFKKYPDSSINSVYNTVVTFIEWYNQQ